ALDNVSDPQAMVGDSQIAWLKADLKQLKPETPIVVLTHRPLFDLYPQWDWAPRDAAAVIDALQPFPHVTVFYGHIHHHAAKSLMFPLPAPGSVPKKAPVAWDPAAPYRGLGFRDIEADVGKPAFKLDELPVVKA